MQLGAVQTKHRSTSEFEGLINRVTGRARESGVNNVHDDRNDRIQGRFIGDAATGKMIIAMPDQQPAAAPAPQRAPGELVARNYTATVSMGRARVPDRLRFRRFGPMNFAKLQSELGRLGSVERGKARPVSWPEGKGIELTGGSVIPFIHYDASRLGEDANIGSAKIGPTLTLVPVRVSENAWHVTLMTELTDFIEYPTLKKTYLDYQTPMRVGDTLVCKSLVPDEVARGSGYGGSPKPAETIVLLTLVER